MGVDRGSIFLKPWRLQFEVIILWGWLGGLGCKISKGVRVGWEMRLLSSEFCMWDAKAGPLLFLAVRFCIIFWRTEI